MSVSSGSATCLSERCAPPAVLASCRNLLNQREAAFGSSRGVEHDRTQVGIRRLDRRGGDSLLLGQLTQDELHLAGHVLRCDLLALDPNVGTGVLQNEGAMLVQEIL